MYLRGVLRQGAGYCDLLSDVVKTVGLLAKSTFDKNIGIDPVFIKGIITNISTIIKTSIADNTQQA